MTLAEVEVRMLWAWGSTLLETRRAAPQETPDRGDGILQWVIMVALLAAAAIIIVAIIVTKATDKANQTQTQ